MAIYLPNLRTKSMKARRESLGGFHDSNACELCLKPLRAEGEWLWMNHETYECVTEAEAVALGVDHASQFQFGADCAKRVRKALAQ